MTIEAMKQGLEALESIRRYGLDTLSGRVDGPDDRDWQRAGVNEMTKRARIGVESLRQAIAEAEKQEPVAWQWLTTAHFRKKLPKDAEKGAWNPLYTHPQPKREPL